MEGQHCTRLRQLVASRLGVFVMRREIALQECPYACSAFQHIRDMASYVTLEQSAGQTHNSHLVFVPAIVRDHVEPRQTDFRIAKVARHVHSMVHCDS